MKRTLKYILGMLLVLVLLVVLPAACLYLPPVQRWAVNRLTAYLGEETGLEVSVGSVHLAFPLDLDVIRLHVAQPPTDAIDVEHVLVRTDLSRLLLLRIGVEAVELSEGNIHLTGLTESLCLNGSIGRLKVMADDINLRERKVSAVEASLDGCDLDVALHETTADTTQSMPVDWQIDISQICICRSRAVLKMPDNEVCVDATIREATLGSGNINIGRGAYGMERISLAVDSLLCDIMDSSSSPEGIRRKEASHLILRDASVCIGHLNYDSLRLVCSGLDLQTPHSFARGDMSLDMSALSPRKHGQLEADVRASLGSEDVLGLAADYLPEGMATYYPPRPLNLNLRAKGNADSLSLQTCTVTMPTVFDIRATGSVQNLTDSTALAADIKWDITTSDLSCIRRYLRLGDVHFPKMEVHADTRLSEASHFFADALLLEGKGRAHLTGDVDMRAMTYRMDTHIADLQLHDFLPHDSLRSLTFNAQLSGHGTDMLDPHTTLRARVDIDHLGYGSSDLDSIHADCTLEKGKLMFEMGSWNDLLCMQGCIDATIAKRKMKAAAFNMDLSHIDFHALGLTAKPFAASMVMHMEGASDFRQTHNLAARIEAMEMKTADSVFHPLDLTLDADFTPRMIRMRALAGDLIFSASSDQGLDSLLARCGAFSRELMRQTDSLCIQHDTLRTLLPHLRLELECGQKNPVCNILHHTTGYTFRDLSLHLLSSPTDGLGGNGHMQGLNTGAILIDTIRWHIGQEQEGISLDVRVANGPKNRMVTFQSQLRALLTATGAQVSLLFLDAKGQKSVDFGLSLDLLADGMRVHFTPLNPIVAYRHFTLNEDNFVYLKRNGHLDALIDLLADDGTGIKVYSTPNEDARQDVSLNIHRLNVGELSRALPFMPDISGFLQGDVHYMQSDSTTTVSAEMLVNKMAYNGVPLGDMGMNGIYFPNADASHYVDCIVTKDGEEIVLLNGKYRDENGQAKIDGDMTLQRVPFSLLNAFMPDGLFALSGYAWGDFAMNGSTDSPILNGELHTDSLFIKAESYNVNLQIPNHTITVGDSHLNLNKIEAYAAGKTPLVLDGNIDFSNLEQVQLDLNVRADNYQLINSPKKQGSLAYGKVFVNVGGRLWGTLSDLKMRGRLDVLGSTDVSCVLTDTPITVDDQLSDIVTFCDFTDTIAVEPTQTKRQNIDIQMNVGIAEASQIHCFLSDNGNDYIDLHGGGEMTMTYDSQNDMQLWGRYTINKGVMRYSLMAIPLNDFRIEQGSYVEFQGNMMNPRLSINASERVRSTVTENNMPRNVAFDVGLALSRTLEDMGLEFTLQAPEDLTVQNQLNAMTAEERGRMAVTMLVTGMYVSDDTEKNGGFNYANTLNAYLQNAINDIAGKALSTVDVNFGVESGVSETGSKTTDYSFSFAKRFWGNRISVIVGGRVSTGRDAINTGQTIIDNISIEYRLDKTASRYVNLFYDRNYESLIEGQVTKMGGGIVLRKKAEKLGELFMFKNKEEKLPIRLNPQSSPDEKKENPPKPATDE